MNQKYFYARWACKALLKRLRFMRIIVVHGPKKTGKSTLVQTNTFRSCTYKNLEKAFDHSLAYDSLAFLDKHNDKLMIIDEAYLEPELILALKQVVDRDTHPGQFIITGSADYRRLPKANESLAGRACIVKMRPLTQAEIRGAEPDFLN